MTSSVLHDVLVALFQQRPQLAAELITDALHVPLPLHDASEVMASDLTQLVPSEYRADVVVRLRRGDDVRHALIVEVQLGKDERKKWTWPLYATALRAREHVPVTLLVLAPRAAVADWASLPIELGQPASAFVPLVLGPSLVPMVTRSADAERSPELALLSVLAHGHGPDATAIAIAAIHSLHLLDADAGRFYYDFILGALNDAARKALEQYMLGIDLSKYEWQSDFAKKHIAQGVAQGVAQGRLEGKIDALLFALNSSGLRPTTEQVAMIRACRDDHALNTWIVRAASASSVADVLDP